MTDTNLTGSEYADKLIREWPDEWTEDSVTAIIDAVAQHLCNRHQLDLQYINVERVADLVRQRMTAVEG